MSNSQNNYTVIHINFVRRIFVFKISHNIFIHISNLHHNIFAIHIIALLIKNFWHFVQDKKNLTIFFMNYGTLILILYLQLLVAKSPLCGREGFVVHIEDKGLTLDWTATGKIPPNL